MTKVKFTLTSISSSWILWSVNHTSIFENYDLNVFKDMKFVGAIYDKLPNGFLEQMYTKLLNLVDNIVNNVTMN